VVSSVAKLAPLSVLAEWCPENPLLPEEVYVLSERVRVRWRCSENNHLWESCARTRMRAPIDPATGRYGASATQCPACAATRGRPSLSPM
jgi:hypothetical protein